MAELSLNQQLDQEQRFNRAMVSLLSSEQPRVDLADCEGERFIRRLRGHGLTGIAYRRLQAGSAAFPPAQVRARLSDLYHRDVAELLHKYQDVSELIDLLGDAEIDFILLKGPALGSLFYQDISERNFSDIDILISKDSWERTQKLLIDDGRIFVENTRSGVGLTGDDLLEHRHFVKSGGTVVEVQLDLLQLGLSTFEFSEPWSRARIAHVEGRPTRILSNEFQLIHLLVHLNKHGFSRLIWVYDLLRVIEVGPIKWDEFARLVRAKHLEVIVYHTLLFVSEIFPRLAVDPRALAEITPSRLRTRVWKYYWPPHKTSLFAGLNDGPIVFHKPLHFRWLIPNLILTGRAGDKVLYMVRKVWPKKEFLRHKLGRPNGGSYLHLYIARILAKLRGARTNKI